MNGTLRVPAFILHPSSFRLHPFITMSCPRCGADSTNLLPGAGGRAVCRRCGTSVVVAGPEGAVAATVLERRKQPPIGTIVFLLVVVFCAGLYLAGRMALRSLEARFRRDQCAQQLQKISVALN